MPHYINVESDIAPEDANADVPEDGNDNAPVRTQLHPPHPIMANPDYTHVGSGPADAAPATAARPYYINVESDIHIAPVSTQRPNLRSCSEPVKPTPRPTLAERRRGSLKTPTFAPPVSLHLQLGVFQRSPVGAAGDVHRVSNLGPTPIALTQMEFTESPISASTLSPRSPIRQSQI